MAGWVAECLLGRAGLSFCGVCQAMSFVGGRLLTCLGFCFWILWRALACWKVCG